MYVEDAQSRSVIVKIKLQWSEICEMNATFRPASCLKRVERSHSFRKCCYKGSLVFTRIFLRGGMNNILFNISLVAGTSLRSW